MAWPISYRATLPISVTAVSVLLASAGLAGQYVGPESRIKQHRTDKGVGGTSLKAH